MVPGILEKNSQNIAHIDLFSKLMCDRIIFIDTEVNDEMMSVIQAQLLYLASVSNEPIQIYINTPGGSVYAGLGIYDTMQYIKKSCVVKTSCIGCAASMGAILLSGGTKGERSALKHSRVMIHQPSGWAQGQASDMNITLVEVQKLKTELYEILVENTGKTYEEVEKDCDRNYWMKSDEAIKYGIIDKIIM